MLQIETKFRVMDSTSQSNVETGITMNSEHSHGSENLDKDINGFNYNVKKRSAKDSNSMNTVSPQPFDVLLGRGRWYAAHPGNRRLQIFINMHLEKYRASDSRTEKTRRTQEILQMIQTCGRQPGRFLKFETALNGWVEVDDDVARLKISQAMRYSIRSSNEDIIPSSMFELGNSRIPYLETSSSAKDSLQSGETTKTQQQSDFEPHPWNENILIQDDTSSSEVSHIPYFDSISSMKFNPEADDERVCGKSDMGPPPPRLAKKKRLDDTDNIISDEEIFSSLGYGPYPFSSNN